MANPARVWLCKGWHLGGESQALVLPQGSSRTPGPALPALTNSTCTKNTPHGHNANVSSSQTEPEPHGKGKAKQWTQPQPQPCLRQWPTQLSAREQGTCMCQCPWQPWGSCCTPCSPRGADVCGQPQDRALLLWFSHREISGVKNWMV